MLELITHSPFTEIAGLLVIAAVLGFIGVMLRQPLIVSFIAVGLIAGPSVLDIVRSEAKIELLSELGIAVLLFLVGIKLDVKLIRSIGGVSLVTGLGQVFFTSLVGYGIGLMLGLDHITSLYVAIALTFSSTIIIVKLLSDKREIDSLHGQIALGFLIVQDLVVVLAMIMLATIGIGAGDGHGGGSISNTALAGLGLVLFVVLFVRYIANPLTEKLAQVPELLVIFAIALAALFAAIGELVGLGMEVGGLLAGVALASTPYRENIAARLAPLRDFLLLFFFIALGSKLDLTQLGGHVPGAVVFSLFVLIGNPLIVLIIMGVMGYSKRTGFLAGLTVAQISEFSLIFVAMGISIGHLQGDILGLITLVGIITIAMSTYMITYSHQLYRWFEPYLNIFERKGAHKEHRGDSASEQGGTTVFLFGLGRLGTAIGQRLHEQGVHVMGVDFNPAAVKQWKQMGFAAQYGDITDAEFIASLPLSKATWCISAIPHHDTGVTHSDSRLILTQLLRSGGFTGKVAVVSHDQAEVVELQAKGIDVVFEPYQDAAQCTIERLLAKP